MSSDASTCEMYFGPANYTDVLPDTESDDMEFYYYLDVEVG